MTAVTVTLRNLIEGTWWDLNVTSIEWAAPSERQAGAATIEIPGHHPARHQNYIAPKTGSYVRILHPDLGVWEGTILQQHKSRTGITLECVDFYWWLTKLGFPLKGVAICATAGAIMRTAVRSAVAGQARFVLREGTFVESAPVFNLYEFNTQTFAQVWVDMMDKSSGELWIEDGAVSWTPMRAPLYPRVLTESGDLLDATESTDGTDRVGSVTARDDVYLDATVVDPKARGEALFSGHKVITVPRRFSPETAERPPHSRVINITGTTNIANDVVGSGGNLGLQRNFSSDNLFKWAKRELILERNPVTEITAQVRRTAYGDATINHWAGLREGAVAYLNASGTGLETGGTFLCAVTRRRWTPGSNYIDCNFRYINRGAWDAEEFNPPRGAPIRDFLRRVAIPVV